MVQSRQEVAFNWIPVLNCEEHEIILPSCRTYATPATWFRPVGHIDGAKQTNFMPVTPSVELETDAVNGPSLSAFTQGFGYVMSMPWVGAFQTTWAPNASPMKRIGTMVVPFMLTGIPCNITLLPATDA